MEKLIPDFILEKRTKNLQSGEFSTAALFFDISGFTHITEKLLSLGSEGVEHLTQLINKIYEPVIDEVYAQGGFIASFAGDAFTALFPHTQESAAVAASNIQAIFQKNKKQTTKAGDFHFQAKITISYGPVQWGILGDKDLTYYFKGRPIERAAKMQLHCLPGKIVAGEEFTHQIKDNLTLQEMDDTIYQVDKVTAPAYQQPEESIIEITYSNASPQFFSPLFKGRPPKAEYRRCIAIFVNFPEVDNHQNFDAFTKLILELCSSYEGFFNGFDFSDKGNTFSVFFGMPLAHENDEERALRFALKLKSAAPEGYKKGLTIGIAAGNVYSGYIGSSTRAVYTAIGDSVNIAAKTMVIAAENAISIDENLASIVNKSNFHIKPQNKEVTIKGKSNPVKLFTVKPKEPGKEIGKEAGGEVGGEGNKEKEPPQQNDAEPYNGDAQSMEKVLERIERLKETNTGGVIGVFGQKGIGKSYFVKKALEKAGAKEETTNSYLLKTDRVLKKSLNPFTFFFRSFFTIDEEHKKSSFITQFNQVLNRAVEKSLNREYNNPEDEKNAHDSLNKLEKLISFLAAIIGIYWAGSTYDKVDPQAKADNVIQSIIEFFKALSLDHPISIIIEDAHDLDQDSKTLLQALTTEIQNYPIILIYTYRTLETSTDHIVFSNQETDLNIFLLPLNKEQTANQVKGIIGTQPGKKLREYIFIKSGGNPLYTEEVTLFLQAVHAIKVDSQMGELLHKPKKLPTGIQALMISRIDRLSPDLKNAVQVASVLGSTINLEVFQLVLDSNDFDQLLSEGSEEKIWKPAIEGEYVFENEMLRQAAYEMQLKDNLTSIHLRVVDIIDELHGDNPVYYADTAYHYKKANHHNAFIYYQKAANYTRANYKNAKALEFYDELLNFEPDPEEELNILYEKACVLELVGQWDEALSLLNLALHQLNSEEFTTIRVKLLVKSGEISQKQGNYENALELLETAVMLLITQDSLNSQQTIILGDAYQWLGRTLWSMGQYNDSMLTLEKSLLQYKKTESRQGEALSLYYIGVTLRDKGNYKRAATYYEKSLTMFEGQNDQRRLTYPLYDIALLDQYRGELEKSQEKFHRIYEIYEEIGYRSGISAALLNLGVIDAKSGRLDKALERYGEALAIAEELNEKLAISYNSFVIGVAYYLKNELDKSLDFFNKALKIAVEIRAQGYYGYTLSYLSCLYAKMGKPSMALKAAMRHFQNIRKTGSDVEHGRSYLGVALALSIIKKKRTTREEYRLKKIIELTGIQATVEAMFQAAAEVAHKSDYVNTLLPTLRFWGIYQRKKGQPKKADKIFQKALKIAQKKAIKREEMKIQKLIEKNREKPEKDG